MKVIKRKVFRSLTSRNNEIGIKEFDGFEVEIGERTYNVYRNGYNMVHIVDPATGRSIFKCHATEISEMNAAKTAVKEFYRTGDSLNRFLEMTKTEEYKTFVNIFNAFELAWELEEGLKKQWESE